LIGERDRGLLVATIIGFITIAASLVTYMGLPSIPAKDSYALKQGVLGPVTECSSSPQLHTRWNDRADNSVYVQSGSVKDLANRRSMAVLLISFTIYTDTSYAIGSVTGQLFVTELQPGTLEYSLYALAQTSCGVICSVGFLWARPYVPIRLKSWLLIGYGLVILVPV
jgi:hypothetical protein